MSASKKVTFDGEHATYETVTPFWVDETQDLTARVEAHSSTPDGAVKSLSIEVESKKSAKPTGWLGFVESAKDVAKVAIGYFLGGAGAKP